MTNPDIETRHSIATSLAQTYLQTKSYCAHLRLGLRTAGSLALLACRTVIHAVFPKCYEREAQEHMEHTVIRDMVQEETRKATRRRL
jgi:hypothetical protein